jgi:hypothetical protein
MTTPAPIKEFLRAKRSGVALFVFGLGLLALPAAFIASGIHYHFSLSWRPQLDYFEYGAAAFGLVCCVSAPFIPAVPVVQRFSLSFVGLVLYVFDLIFSAVASIMVFGFN